jgi:hypothetical protein
LKVQRVSDIRQIEIHTTEPFVPESSPFGTEIAKENLKNYKSLGNDQILSLLVQVGDDTLRSEIQKVINFNWSKTKLSCQWQESIIVPIYRKGDKSACNNYRRISVLKTSYKNLSNILLSA